MKILFFMPGFPGLTEAYRVDQFMSLIRRGYDVSVLAMKRPKSIFIEELDGIDLIKSTTYLYVNGSRGIRLILFFKWFLKAFIINPLNSFRIIYKTFIHSNFLSYSTILFYLSVKKIDIIHVHFGHAGVFVKDIKKFTDIPIIVSFYGWDYSQDLPSRKEEYNKMFNAVDGITAMNNFMKKRLLEFGCPENKIDIIRIWAKDDFNLVGNLPPKSSQNNVIRILSIGRLEEKKGYKYCLNAISKLKNMHYDVEYQIIGEGGLEKELKELTNQLSIDNITHFEGLKSRNEIISYINNTDIFLLHSVTGVNGDMEGTPTVILESGLSQKPVVSTYHAGIPEIIKNNESGFLVQERDTDTMVKYLIKLISNSDLRNKFGFNLKEYINKEYSEETNHKRFIKKYSKYISR